MNKPVLVVMAAGMGSRYGGLKQIEPLGPNGEIIIDYSINDAKKAGFETVVFIIKSSIEKDFKEAVGKRIEKTMNVLYAFQETDLLPKGYTLPLNREKPWGTAHAICAIKDIVKSPFAVINADDYYGPSAFLEVFNYLSSKKEKTPYPFSMVAYNLKNTLTENGYVSRGICTVDENNKLLSVKEHTNIIKTETGAAFLDGEDYKEIDENSFVSMNLWGFTEDFIKESWDGFSLFLDKALIENPLRGEYYLPSVVSSLIDENKAEVLVLKSRDKWYGVTYKEDKESVKQALKEMHENGLYDNLLAL